MKRTIYHLFVWNLTFNGKKSFSECMVEMGSKRIEKIIGFDEFRL